MKHVVGLCIYKEPQALIMDTIDSIASQPDAKVVFLLLFLAEIGDVLNNLFDHSEKSRFLTVFVNLHFFPHSVFWKS